jgi:micrococcal nuclease
VGTGGGGTARRDRQGRHLAQAFVIDGDRETWVQGHMLREGHGRASQQKDARGCLADLLAHEHVARMAGLGVWAVAAYQMRRAAWTRDLDGLAARFVVMRGRIAWVTAGREVIALGFTAARTGAGATRWQMRRGVIVVIDGRDRDLLGTFGGEAGALQGRDVEVRGWLETRLGRPAGTYVMDISLAGALVVADQDAPPQ